jgi:hypothetical protein
MIKEFLIYSIVGLILVVVICKFYNQNRFNTKLNSRINQYVSEYSQIKDEEKQFGRKI